MTNLDRNSSTGSSVRPGRCAMSMTTPFRDARYMTVATYGGGHLPPPGRATTTRVADRVCPLLRVKLDDELFLHLSVDLGTGRHGVDQDTHLGRDYLQPRRGRTLTSLGTGHDERGQLRGPGVPSASPGSGAGTRSPSAGCGHVHRAGTA